MLSLAALTAALQFQTAAQLPWVLVFYCVAPLYCVWTTTLVLISAVKIASGRVGAWHVTRRANSTSSNLDATAYVRQFPSPFTKLVARFVTFVISSISARSSEEPVPRSTPSTSRSRTCSRRQCGALERRRSSMISWRGY